MSCLAPCQVIECEGVNDYTYTLNVAAPTPEPAASPTPAPFGNELLRWVCPEAAPSAYPEGDLDSPADEIL